jgi:hypothetical protein
LFDLAAMFCKTAPLIYGVGVVNPQCMFGSLIFANNTNSVCTTRNSMSWKLPTICRHGVFLKLLQSHQCPKRGTLDKYRPRQDFASDNATPPELPRRLFPKFVPPKAIDIAKRRTSLRRHGGTAGWSPFCNGSSATLIASN